MTDEKETKSWFKGGLGVALTILKGFLIPVSLGLIGYSFSWPLGHLSCTYYGEATEHPTKFVWWNCYVQDKEGVWLSKQEYQSTRLGMRLILGTEK